MGVPYNDGTTFKESFQVCQHAVKGKGCGIYDDRPKACRDFSCLWLYGMIGGPRERPDKVGIVMMPTGDDQRIQCMEVWPGASVSGSARVVIEAIRKVMDVVVVKQDGRRTLLTVEGRPLPGVMQRDLTHKENG